MLCAPCVNPNNLYGNCLAFLLQNSKDMSFGNSLNNIKIYLYFNKAVESPCGLTKTNR